jgi:hypothetical protein
MRGEHPRGVSYPCKKSANKVVAVVLISASTFWFRAAREWLERRRNEAIAELTLAVAAIAMVAAIVAAVRS